MEKVRLTDDQVNLVKSWSAISNGDMWYFIPCWFKEVGDNVFEIHKLGQLPDDLVNFASGLRDAVDNQTPDFANKIEHIDHSWKDKP